MKGNAKPRVNQIEDETEASSSESDSDAEAVCLMMKNGQIDPKKGRKMIRRLRKQGRRNTGKPRVQAVQAPETNPDNQEDIRENVRILQVQMLDVVDRLNFLGESPSKQKRK